MLGINMDDVMTTIGILQNYLIALAVFLVLAIVVTIAAIKIKKPLKGLVRGTSWVAFVMALVIIVDLILTGPMYSMVSMVFRPASEISEESITEASALGEEIANEGFVLLKNDGILPLSSGTKVNTFGWSSTNPVYGGTGSGSLSANFPTISLLEGLSNAGIEYNTDLTDFYAAWRTTRPTIGMFGQDWTIPEPSMDEYDAAGLFESAAAYSDTAIIVIARSGGEGADLPTSLDSTKETPFQEAGWATSGLRYSEYPEDKDASKHYLELSNREKAMVDRVTGDYDDVIVVINASNAMELGWVEDYPSIKAVILAPGPGQTGFNALGNILTGEVNPSGRTIDTYVYDLSASPNYNNIGNFVYTNMGDVSLESADFLGNVSTLTPTFVNYVEGIYVGYRWYETAAVEGFIDYEKTVQYPFGYGLSYTTFSQEMGAISESNGNISFDVTVTNTGSVAGKDVVEVYYNPPYTNGGIEKSAANLVAFAKTGIIDPGKSESVTISFAVEDMASFDYKGTGAYVLEAGDYEISINTDSHNKIDSQTYTVSSTVTYGEGNKRESDVTAATSVFEYAAGDITYLSRANSFANYDEATAAPASYEMPAEDKANFLNNVNYDPTQFNNANDVMPTQGVAGNLVLSDLRGVDYDDAKWDQLLNQLTVSEMVELIGTGGYMSIALPSIGKTQQIDCDGPASINNNFNGQASIGFPAGVVIAATWNVELAKEFGRSIGKMADEMDVSGWYAPAMNIHRSAFSGRNFEYYSEDGYISGAMASSAVLGASESGVYAFIKHFALNDQETNRNSMICTWSNEQAIREIYLKPFEMCVKNYDFAAHNPMAVMSAFNYIGYRWAGATPQLLNNVLRDEWGFIGMVLTDYFGGYGCMDADIAIRSGNDFCLTPQMTPESTVTDQASATSVLAMRQASKNILYTTANSRAYASGINGNMATWEIVMYVISAVIIIAAIACEVLLVKGYLGKKKKNA